MLFLERKEIEPYEERRAKRPQALLVAADWASRSRDRRFARSLLFLVRPGATSSVLVPSSDALELVILALCRGPTTLG